MRTFSSSFVSELNRLEGTRAWAHVVEISVSANSTAYFTTSPDTHVWNSNTYRPIPMSIGEEEQSADGSLPRLFVDVSNYAGQAFAFAKDNDLSLRDVTVRLVNLSFPNSGDDARITMQILGAVFYNEAARFNLGFDFNFDAEGPRNTWNRRDHPSIPISFRTYALV